MRLFFLPAVVLVLFASGCVIEPAGSGDAGIRVNAVADPFTVFAGSTTNVYVDVENKGMTNFNNVIMDVYYTGLLRNEGPACAKRIDVIEPGEITSTGLCQLKAPDIEDIKSSTMPTSIGVSAKFSGMLTAVPLIEMITESEYRNMVMTGEWETKSGSYTYSDGNIELQVDFSDKLPIVVRPDKKAYIYFTIKKLGNGYISNMNDGRISIEDSQAIVRCSPIGELVPEGDTFPRIACELVLPTGIEYLSSYRITLSIYYDYEIRKELQIKIVR